MSSSGRSSPSSTNAASVRNCRRARSTWHSADRLLPAGTGGYPICCMSSNIKPKAPAQEAPTEPFKPAVTRCLRAVRRHPGNEFGLSAGGPGLAGGKARLPEPPRRLSPEDAAIVRGHADSIALRLACHDAAVHRKLMPGGQQARAVFEAVEQARVEAIGARRMHGV